MHEHVDQSDGKLQIDAERVGRFRRCVSRFATGVAVVSFEADSDFYGLTVNSFTSVSLEPMLVLVGIARRSRAHDVLLDRSFCVNILGAEQEALARHFAGRGVAVEPSWTAGTVAPRLGGCLAYLECLPWQHHEAGDHTLFIGEVVDFDLRVGDALTFAWSEFVALSSPIIGEEYFS